ncbi:MAG: ATP-dependent DNA helicase RecQ [Hyphomicrobiaceae bacterium]
MIESFQTDQTVATDAELHAALATLGHETFRDGQRETILELFSGGRVLLVAPTGGGKSLTYQLPALLLPGTTLVISPLVSLMQDQVEALEELGVAATFLAATLPAAEMRLRMRKLADGEFKLAYVAPERLAYEGFRSILASLDCPLVAIDEAHCISEWGHDFRPEYMQIGAVVGSMPKARILACTATATPVVRDEIIARLGLPPETPQLVRGFARPNLALRARDVLSRRDRDKQVDAVLAEALGSPGHARGTAIVYSPTRKATEEEATRLEAAGWRADPYHAGMAGSRREQVLRAFSQGQTEIVVATNAFGMGIDRADVRVVVHLAPPGSVESYYQEVGRAGRDGEDAIGLLLLSSGDMPLRRHLIELPTDGRAPDPDNVRHKWNLFLELMRWAEGGSCRHDAILRYFGDEEETVGNCGRCDVCTDLSRSDESDIEETTLIVRKALSAVARIHDRFGLQAAARLLVGAKDPRLEAAGLTETKTHGALAVHGLDWVVRLLRRTVTAGWVDFRGGDRPVVILTEEGREVMMGQRPARIMLPPVATKGAPSASGSGRTPRQPRQAGQAGQAGQAAQTAINELDETGRMVFEALRSHRLQVAKEEGVPPYIVASDRSLRDIAALRPRNRAELELAHGIGPSKADRYGEGLLRVVSEAQGGEPS